MAELVREGQGALPGPVGGRPRDAAARVPHPPHRRAAERVFAVVARARAGRASRVPRARHRLRPLQSARTRLPERRRERPRPPANRTTCGAAFPRFQGENLQQQRRAGATSRRDGRARRDARRRSSRSPGCSRRATTSCRFPGTKRRRYLEDNAAATEIALTPEEVAALDEAFPVGSAAGERYPPASMTLLETEQAS